MTSGLSWTLAITLRNKPCRLDVPSQFTRDFYRVGIPVRPAKSRLFPQLPTNQRQRVGEGRMGLVVPRRSPRGAGERCLLPVGEEGDQREQPQQRRGSPSDRHFRPMPLRLKPEALTSLLKSSFHLPAPHEPGDDPFRLSAKVGAQQGLSVELSFGIADQYPAHRHSRQPRALPDGGIWDRLHRAFSTTVAVRDHDLLPAGRRVFGNNREVRHTLTLQARSAYLTWKAWRSWLVEGGVQP